MIKNNINNYNDRLINIIMIELFFRFITSTVHFFAESLSPISRTYFNVLDSCGFAFYQSLIFSSFLYVGIMTAIFYLRRWMLGDYRTNMITEFATTPYEVRLCNFGKGIVFSWNIFMMLISIVLSCLMSIAYYDVGQSLTPSLNLFNPSDFVTLSLIPSLSNITCNIGDHVITPMTIVYFLLSTKFLEWIDTAINLSTGRSVILLHFWHHCTIVASFSTGAYSSACMVLVLINSMIHVVMYLYYALSVFSSIRPYLNRFKIFITVTQIIQFVIGICIGFIHYVPAYHDLGMIYYNRGPERANNVLSWGPGHGQVVGDTMMYHIVTELLVISYLVMFLQFFYKTYRNNK